MELVNDSRVKILNHLGKHKIVVYRHNKSYDFVVGILEVDNKRLYFLDNCAHNDSSALANVYVFTLNKEYNENLHSYHSTWNWDGGLERLYEHNIDHVMQVEGMPSDQEVINRLKLMQTLQSKGIEINACGFDDGLYITLWCDNKKICELSATEYINMRKEVEK